jgi:hypothetical protein
MAAKKRRRRHTVPDRRDLIAALGLEPEGTKRGDKYDFSTKEFYAKVLTGESKAAKRARRILGVRG